MAIVSNAVRDSTTNVDVVNDHVDAGSIVYLNRVSVMEPSYIDLVARAADLVTVVFENVPI